MKIALQSVKGQGFFCVPVGGNPDRHQSWLFMLNHGQNSHPAGSVKITLQSVKREGIFLFCWVATLTDIKVTFGHWFSVT